MDHKPSGIPPNNIGGNEKNNGNSLTAESAVKTLESAGDMEIKDVQQQTEEHEAKQSAKYGTFGGVFPQPY